MKEIGSFALKNVEKATEMSYQFIELESHDPLHREGTPIARVMTAFMESIIL